MTEYRKITYEELHTDYFLSFRHEQSWDKQWVKTDNSWTLQSKNDFRSWSFEKRIWISQYIKEQITDGGFAIGAFENETLVGFVCVNGTIIDTYANLTMLFIDDNYKRKGIGRALFQRAKQEALLIGAKKLFISAIPSMQTISFYFSVGCKDAEKIISAFVDTDMDRYLEVSL